MTYSHHDRLSALDAAFLDIEDSNAHMHIGSVAIFDAGAVQTEDGALDFDRIRAFVDLALRRNARFRQKVARVPLLGNPVWIDDETFNLSYHLRHSCLPTPGSLRLLKRLAGRIMSQQLDRGKPLWEMWVVEGIEGNRFSVILKVHHCLADGVSGVDLLSAFMGPDASYEPQPAGHWVPRPAPGGRRLLAGELAHRARAPLALLGAGLRALSKARAPVDTAREVAQELRESLDAGIHPASETPFNMDLGPHRRFDWTRFDLEAAREVKRRFGGTLNDVALSVVAGAVRRFLRGRGLRVEDLDFRAIVPVSLRSDGERGALGNRVFQLMARLPLAERDPVRRHERVVETTSELKRSGRRPGGAALLELAELSATGLLGWLARVGLQIRAANLVVTNVPGPTVPVYLLGARMLEVYPVVPLGANQTLGVALLSYADGLHWGINTDWDALPDLHDFVEAVDLEFETLRKAAAEAAAADGGRLGPPADVAHPEGEVG